MNASKKKVHRRGYWYIWISCNGRKWKGKKLKANNLLKYYVADACDLPFKITLLHMFSVDVILHLYKIGNSFEWNSSMFKPHGKHVHFNFYYRRKISDKLINDVYNAIISDPILCGLWNTGISFFLKDYSCFRRKPWDGISKWRWVKTDIYDYIFNRNEFTKGLNGSFRMYFLKDF